MAFLNENISDKDILTECLKGKEWAWEIFYGRFSRLVSSVVKRAALRYGSVVTHEEINDCRQSVWAAFIENDCYILKKWGERCSLATWLRVCSSHAAARYFGSITKQPPFTPIDFVPPMPIDINRQSSQDSFDEVSRKELLEKILDIIENRLSRQERLFAKLYWFKKLPPKEISNIMGISIENTHLLRHRAEKKIKKHIKDTV